MLKGIAKEIFEKCSSDLVYTEADDLRRYITGFHSSFGIVTIERDKTTFFTDMRYLEAATNACRDNGVDVRLYKKNEIEELLSKYSGKVVALPLDRVTYPAIKSLEKYKFKVVDSCPVFEQCMTIKKDFEIANIQKACSVAEEAFLMWINELKEGVTENEMAGLLEYYMRKCGAESTSFSTICCFGASSSCPHHEPDNTKLKHKDVVLVDFGCKINGYCSDITRTFLFGDNGRDDFKKAYSAVYGAHMKALEEIKEGMTGAEADAIARDYLEERGLGKYFTHSLGHGIGINIHEYPRLSTAATNVVLKNGMVFSDEPGVYFEGDFGIRIEDSVRMENGAVKTFMTKTNKDLVIL